MIPAILTAINAPSDMADQAYRGRKEVVAKYDWNRQADRLEGVWHDCLAPVSAAQPRCGT
jgi:hypothetical protein